jgi:polar amino acid transport system substrate-binding protein
MRKLVVLATVVLAATAALAACGGDDDDSAADNTTTTAAGASVDCTLQTVTPDTLTIVTSLPGPGFWEGSDSDPTKLTSGYEYDIAKSIQQKCGLSKMVVRNVSFDAIVAGTVKDYDLALSQISITDERKQVVDFSEPYFESNQGVLVKADSGVDVKTLDDAKKVQWGVQTATTAIDLLDKIAPDKQPRVYPQLADGYTALQAGQVDAFLIDTAINLGEAARSNGVFEVVSQFSQESGPDQYGALFPKGSANVDAINKVLTAMKDSGELDDLTKKDLTANPADLPLINVP